MNNEIKVGDKVRVSKDIPQFYRRYNLYRVFEVEHHVVDIEDGLALLDSIPPKYVTTLPLKYLIKVEDEAKEPKFKAGEKVRYKKNPSLSFIISSIMDDGMLSYWEEDYDGLKTQRLVHPDYVEPYTEPTAPTIKVGDRVCCYNILHIKGSKKEDYMGYVASITDMGITIQLDKGGLVLVYHESDLELVQPKEQTEAEKTDTDNIVDDFAKVMEGYRKVFADITDNFDWLRYEADLAKEIALKVANKYSDPKEAAGYAVSVAKAVVENLKKK